MRSWIGRASSLAAQVMIVQLGTTSPRGALPRVQSPAKQSVLASEASSTSSGWPRGVSFRTTGRPSRTAAQTSATFPPGSGRTSSSSQASAARLRLLSTSLASLSRSLSGQ